MSKALKLCVLLAIAIGTLRVAAILKTSKDPVLQLTTLKIGQPFP